MAEKGKESCRDLANLASIEDVVRTSQGATCEYPEEPPSHRSRINPAEVETLVENIQTVLSLYSPNAPSTSIQGKQNQVFNSCTFNVTVSQGDSGTSVEDNLEEEGNSFQRVSSSLTNLGFQQFQRGLCEIFKTSSRRWFEMLTKMFAFSSAETDAVLEPLNKWRFVRLLREKGVINSTDITHFTNLLKDNGPLNKIFRSTKVLTEKIEKSFECNRLLVIPPKLLGKTEHLVNALKSRYKHRYLSVRVIPYHWETWRSVNEIFVATHIEKLNSRFSPNHRAWTKVSLYHEVISLDSDANRIVVHSDPGYGKSTLLQQFAYDWCMSSADSPLQYVTVFILIRLKELKGVKSIYDAIRTLVPVESMLTTSDLKDILTSSWVHVVFGFDGFDEYINADIADSEITKIINGEMFPSFGVVVTTRSSCLQHLQSTPMTTFRLTGFDDTMQESYIEKVYAATPTDTDKTVSRIQESDILRAICQVPFFFALYVHISVENEVKSRYNSVTGYFSHMIACLFSHMHNEGKEHVQSSDEIGEETLNHRLRLGKMAYDGLADKTPKLIWSENEMLQELGCDCYGLYVKTGILLIEHDQVFVSEPGSHLRDHLAKRSTVSFFHITLQEYYAAMFIAQQSKNISELEFTQSLKKIDRNNSQYVFRFTCGLDPLAARVVLHYLQSLGKDADMDTILCVLEQGGVGINDVIRELCGRQVIFSRGESKLLQRSKIRLLQVASERKIPINSVSLLHCLVHSCRYPKQRIFREELGKNTSRKVFPCIPKEYTGDSLELCTGLSLPNLDTLQMIMIDEIHDLRVKTSDILLYATKCRGLKTIIFNLALMPESVRDWYLLDSLRMQKCEVQWIFKGNFWLLDLTTGNWTDPKGKPMRKPAYKSKKDYVNRFEHPQQSAGRDTETEFRMPFRHSEARDSESHSAGRGTESEVRIPPRRLWTRRGERDSARRDTETELRMPFRHSAARGGESHSAGRGTESEVRIPPRRLWTTTGERDNAAKH